MSANDNKIKVLLNEIETKRAALGTKPKGNWKTNGVLKTIGFEDGVNINTLHFTGKCIDIAAGILLERMTYTEACKTLGLPEYESERLASLSDALDDLKLRVQMILWDQEKKKLTALEAKLKDLRSNDAKTEDALAEIAQSLK